MDRQGCELSRCGEWCDQTSERHEAPWESYRDRLCQDGKVQSGTASSALFVPLTGGSALTPPDFPRCRVRVGITEPILRVTGTPVCKGG